jgi:nitroreductase
MNWWKLSLILALVAAAAVILAAGISTAQQPASAPAMAAASAPAKVINLPKPHMEGGMPLMEALKNRQSARAYSDKPISDQVLSDLLWAAFGINRPDGKRTAPSAMNWQEFDIYVFRPDGTYLYDAKANTLKEVVAKDLRSQTGGQRFVGTAPLNLVFVADLSRIRQGGSEEGNLAMVNADAGFISQNVYLFCASEHLATVVRAMVPKKPLGEALSLGETQRIILAQTIGYPGSAPAATRPGG